jgi:hypothetical protein
MLKTSLMELREWNKEQEEQISLLHSATSKKEHTSKEETEQKG